MSTPSIAMETTSFHISDRNDAAWFSLRTHVLGLLQLLHYSIFSFFFFSAALAFIPFDNIGAVRGLQTNSKATVEEKQQMVSRNNATSTFMFQSMRPLFIYHHIGMREGFRPSCCHLILSIDSSTKRIIVYKRNIQYQNVVLEINTKNSATTIFRSCVTVILADEH